MIKELCELPIKSNHGVYYNPIYDSLDQSVWDLNDSLQKSVRACLSNLPGICGLDSFTVHEQILMLQR